MERATYHIWYNRLIMAASTDAPAFTTFTLTNGGTAQLMLAANQQRTALTIQPQTEASVINFGATAGVQATGALTVAVNPANNETIAVNGVTFTFKTSASTSTEVQIGGDNDETAVNFAAKLNASANASISVATYSNTTAQNVVDITYDAGGTDGNAYALAVSSGGNVTRSAATLTGGLNTGNGLQLADEQIVFFSASEYPSIKNDIYIVSATNSAKTVYLEGIASA